jgi:ketosteroid isomerase-like protein
MVGMVTHSTYFGSNRDALDRVCGAFPNSSPAYADLTRPALRPILPAMAQFQTVTPRSRRGSRFSLLCASTGLALFFSLAACSPEVDVSAQRALLTRADALYTSTANAGDVEGLTALYAQDATRYPPNGEPSHGLEAMRAFAEGVASTPGFHLTAHPQAREVSESGDMGYTLNLLELSVTGEDGSSEVQWLRDFHVWRMGPDGAWRIVEDIWHVMEQAPSPDTVG